LIVGVISDTHGLFRLQAIAALSDCEHIIHAGDIGSAELLEELRKIAPLSVVRGNIDTAKWASSLPEIEWLTFAGTNIYVLHDLKMLDLDPRAADLSVVISGHTHQPLQERKNGILYLNPGSAGPRRFSLPISLAKLTLAVGGANAELITLDP
jgi:putative phosphoesterase